MIDRRAGSVALILALSRIAVLAGHTLAWTRWSPVAYLWQDAAVLLAFAAVDRGLGRTPRLAWIVYAAFGLYIAATLPAALVMSTPMTWPMWRAAGGTIGDSIWRYATPENLAWLVVLVVAGAVAPILAPFVSLSSAWRHAVVVLTIGVVALGPTAITRVDTHGLDRNAWSALAIGLFPRVPAQAAVTDWRVPPVAYAAGAPDRGHASDLSRLRGAAAGRNVVLVSLESTAAQYVGVYGARPDATPNLTALARAALVFDRAYAVYPESIKGLQSVLCSTYPTFDRRVETSATAPCRSIASVLSARGYHTALFHSGRFGYLGMDRVIRDRGFDLLADAGEIGGNRESSFGVDDAATAAHLLGWIDSLPRGEPFFVTYLPIAGHHPYDAPEPGPFPDPDDLGRYRNALHYGDAVLGSLVRGLDVRGHGRDTLWLVIGDHGEAFGQHDGNFGHTFQLFEENVHVPFIVAVPGLTASETRLSDLVSLIDTAPTLLDLLGIDAPQTYQGQSALDAGPRMALFFADYSLGLLGLRDGSSKYIYEIESARSRLFDLERDPGELHDIAEHYPDRTAWYRERLLAWIAAQTRQ